MAQEGTPRIHTSSEYAHVQSHGIVLEHGHEEHPKQQERPDEHICHDPCRQAMRVYHRSPAPEQRDEIPGQWSRDHGDVDKVRSGWMTEVDGDQVEEVEHKHELSGPEVGADPEEKKGRLQYIVDNEMASDVGSSVNPLGVVRKEMPDVADLKDKKRNPTRSQLATAIPLVL